MRVSRRAFIESAAAAAAVPLGWRLGRASVGIAEDARHVVVDLGEKCALHESVSGYSKLLGAAAARTDWSGFDRCDTLIVPAAVDIPQPVCDAMAACLRSGGLVLLESGAAFADDHVFRRHRTMLDNEWQVTLADPVSLWLDPPARGAPYVDFVWPFPTKIRDFSRVVPLESSAGKIIASVNGLPAAVKRRGGRGTLIVLGTPIGPALWAGDAEARRWLRAVLTT